MVQQCVEHTCAFLQCAIDDQIGNQIKMINWLLFRNKATLCNIHTLRIIYISLSELIHRYTCRTTFICFSWYLLFTTRYIPYVCVCVCYFISKSHMCIIDTNRKLKVYSFIATIIWRFTYTRNEKKQINIQRSKQIKELSMKQTYKKWIEEQEVKMV